MTETINEPVSVALVFSADKRRTTPWVLEWRKQRWRVTEVGFHHYYNEGTRLIHVFEVVANNRLHMRLVYDTQGLNWTLAEVSDGQAE